MQPDAPEIIRFPTLWFAVASAMKENLQFGAIGTPYSPESPKSLNAPVSDWHPVAGSGGNSSHGCCQGLPEEKSARR